LSQRLCSNKTWGMFSPRLLLVCYCRLYLVSIQKSKTTYMCIFLFSLILNSFVMMFLLHFYFIAFLEPSNRSAKKDLFTSNKNFYYLQSNIFQFYYFVMFWSYSYWDCRDWAWGNGFRTRLKSLFENITLRYFATCDKYLYF